MKIIKGFLSLHTWSKISHFFFIRAFLCSQRKLTFEKDSRQSLNGRLKIMVNLFNTKYIFMPFMEDT